MRKLIKTGQIIFATGIFALGFVCILFKDFIIGRPPAWPTAITLNPALGYISGAIIMFAGVSMLIKKKAALAAIIVAVLILVLSVFRELPHFASNWLNACKTIALLGGALIVSISFSAEDPAAGPAFMSNNRYTRKRLLTGCILLAIFFIAGGYSHFKYAQFVESFIPAYIPFRAFWAYFCGICLIAGGIGILIPQTRSLAALLSGWMVLGWFVLLHIPRFIIEPYNASDTMGLCESFTFAGIFFVLAGLSKSAITKQ